MISHQRFLALQNDKYLLSYATGPHYNSQLQIIAQNKISVYGTILFFMALKYQFLDHQFLHKCPKDKHQPSGRSLLLIISTSVAKNFMQVHYPKK